MLPPNRRLERLRKRFGMYRMHHKVCLMMHQNHSVSELFVKPEIRPIPTNDSIARASCTVKRRHKKLQCGMVSNHINSSLNRNKNISQQTQMLNRSRMLCDQMPASSALSNMLSNPVTHPQTDDLDFVDSLEYLLNFGNGVTVLPVLHDIEILDYFERIAN